MDETNNENSTNGNVGSKIKKVKDNVCTFAKDNFLKLQVSSFNLFLTVVIAMVIMFVTAAAVFFSTVKGEEQVMVPNVLGKQLTTALLEMQVKELYPKIQLRYTNDDSDAGTILAQSPDGGAIVKAGERVNLTVSEGADINEVGDYVGQKYEDVKKKLEVIYQRSSKPLLSLGEPSFKNDGSPAGTIIAQTPEPGTRVSSPTSIRLIVSSGSEQDSTTVPNLVGKDVSAVLNELKNTKVIFDFTQKVATDEASAGKVTKQDSTATTVKNYTRINCEFSVPSVQKEDKYIGLFTAKLADFPMAVTMKLEAVSGDGKSQTVATFSHVGGNVSIPYAVSRDSELVLSVGGNIVARQKLN